MPNEQSEFAKFMSEPEVPQMETPVNVEAQPQVQQTAELPEPQVQAPTAFSKFMAEPEVPQQSVAQPQPQSAFAKFMAEPEQQPIRGPIDTKLAKWEDSIQRHSQNYGVPPELVKAVMWQESRGNAKARSIVKGQPGAIGLMQLMPTTAQYLGVNPNDPDQNIEGGVKYLRELMDEFGSDNIDAVLSAYNAGPGAVRKYQKQGRQVPYAETVNYREKIKANYNPAKASASLSNPFGQPKARDYPVPQTAEELDDQRRLSEIEDMPITSWKDVARLATSQVIGTMISPAPGVSTAAGEWFTSKVLGWEPDTKAARLRQTYTQGLFEGLSLGNINIDLIKPTTALEKGVSSVSKVGGGIAGFVAATNLIGAGAGLAGLTGATVKGKLLLSGIEGLAVGLASKPQGEEDTITNRLKDAAISGVLFTGLTGAGIGVKRLGGKVLDWASRKLISDTQFPIATRMQAREAMKELTARHAKIAAVVDGIKTHYRVIERGKNKGQIVELTKKQLTKMKANALSSLDKSTKKLQARALAKLGVDPDVLTAAKEPAIYKWAYNRAERMGLVDGRYPGASTYDLHIRTMEADKQADVIINDMIEKLDPGSVRKAMKATKLTEREIVTLAEKTITNKNGLIVWAGKGKQPVGADWEAVKSIRTLLNKDYQYAVNSGLNVKYKPGYVPRSYKGPIRGTTSKKPLKNLTKLSQEQARVLPDELPEVYKEIRKYDINKLIAQRIKKTAKIIAFRNNNIGELAMHNHTYFRLLGQNAMADDVAKYAYKSIGINSKNTVSSILANDIIDYSAKDIKKIMANIDLMDDSVAWRFGSAIKKSMMEALVFMNPKTFLGKQSIQPWVTYGATGGSATRGSVLAKTAKYRKMFNDKEIGGKLLGAGSVDIAELGMKSGKKGLLAKIFSSPAYLGKKVFNYGDRGNRKVVFADMYHRIEKAASSSNKEAISKALSSMTTPEQIMVREGLAQSIHEGSVRAGLIMSGRHNYFYTPLDLPLVLDNPLGRLIPFTTWPRNQLMRYLGDINMGNYRQMAKRLAYPLATLAAFQALTGHKMSGAHPVSSIAGLGSMQVLPMLSQPLEQIAQGNFTKAFTTMLKFTPPGALIKRAGQIQKNGIMKGFGFEPVEGHPFAGE